MAEATMLIESACKVGNLNLISKMYTEKSADELRKLVATVRLKEMIVIVIGAIEGMKLSLVVGCSNNVPLDAREIMKFLLRRFNGQGGGDQFIAQGGCNLPTEGLTDIFESTKTYLLHEINHN
jgi:alanyl-tRNA synthetase